MYMFFGSHTFPYQFLLLSTTIFNDIDDIDGGRGGAIGLQPLLNLRVPCMIYWLGGTL